MRRSRKPTRRPAREIREDGAYVEAGENDNLIVQKLEANPAAFGIFGFSFLDQNADKLQGRHGRRRRADLRETSRRATTRCPARSSSMSRRSMSADPGIEEFVAEYTSDEAWGDEGYLAEKGLIPLPEAERAQSAEMREEHGACCTL